MKSPSHPTLLLSRGNSMSLRSPIVWFFSVIIIFGGGGGWRGWWGRLHGGRHRSLDAVIIILILGLMTRRNDLERIKGTEIVNYGT